MKMDLQKFGGRGATAGGTTGGSGTANVVSATSLISERENSQKEVDDTLEVLRRVNEQYGSVLEDVQVVELKGASKRALAYYDSKGNLAVNKAYFNTATMDEAMDRTAKSGFHPSRGNKSGMEAVVAHEMGHKLTDQIGMKNGGKQFFNIDKTANTVMQEAKKQGGFKSIADMRKQISGYAKTNNAEALAEAFADVYCNGNKANKASRAIVNVMNNMLK